jgi:hypothetical protein
MDKFPRALTEKEKYLLFKVLPENKSGYRKYRDKIEELVVIGQGRFSRDNMILGMPGKKPDLSFPSTPVFAIGTVICKETQIDIAIHEEIDNEIEFDISTNNAYKPDEDLTELSNWSYSEWVPGMDAPNDNSEVKEVGVIPGGLILTIAPKHKKIWLHNIETGVNHLIPLSNFYNQLMMVRDIRNTKVALNPGLFFDQLDNYSDGDLVSALITYNKYIKRFNIDLSYFEKSDNKPSQKNLFSFLRRGKN